MKKERENSKNRTETIETDRERDRTLPTKQENKKRRFTKLIYTKAND